MESGFLDPTKVYTEQQAAAISTEFARLQGQHYLEHAGATLYSEKQIQGATSQLLDNVYGNTHANNLPSKMTEDCVDLVRFELLSHFNTSSEDYAVIFTSGATAALKLLGESFDFGQGGAFAYLQDNHTSVLGIRNYAPSTRCLTIDEATATFSTNNSNNNNKRCHDKNGTVNNSLFAYPASSNFNGAKYPLEWVERVRNGALEEPGRYQEWFTVLDAASFVATNPLDLDAVKPDFVCCSFYKMFGFPTGLGALLVKRSSEAVLRKRYFGGGTVLMVLSLENETVPKTSIEERFEDGTLNFLSILAVRHGFQTVRRLGLDFGLISEHTFALARHVFRSLSCFHHANGRPVAVLYHGRSGFGDRRRQGGIVNFNLLRDDGEHVGYSEVSHLCGLYAIHLRTGCCCNPGACQHHLGLSSDDVRRHFELDHVCGDLNDLIDGHPTGSVRVSFGYMSTVADADALLRMVRECFVSGRLLLKLPQGMTREELRIKGDNCKEPPPPGGVLRQILLYPVKSCGALSVADAWPLTSTGLKFDREWMVVNPLGVCMTQKHNRRMCLVRPAVDVARGVLVLTYAGSPPEAGIAVPLTMANDLSQETFSARCLGKVCNNMVKCYDCGNEAADWLSRVLDHRGLRLMRQCDRDSGLLGSNEQPQLSLSNKAQFLLVNNASVEWLRSRIADCGEFDEKVHVTTQRFRPNFVVEFPEAFLENDYSEFLFGDVRFKTGGKCTRCQMICIDQFSGKASKEPLQTLSREFKGKICFGVYLNCAASSRHWSKDLLQVGCEVVGLKL